MTETRREVFEAAVSNWAADVACSVANTEDDYNAIYAKVQADWDDRYEAAVNDTKDWVDGYAEGHEEGFRAGKMATAASLTGQEVFALYRERRKAENEAEQRRMRVDKWVETRGRLLGRPHPEENE